MSNKAKENQSTKKSQKQEPKKSALVRSTSVPQKVDPLKQYLSEISRYNILTPEEEKEIAEHYRDHQDKESAQKLILSNLRLVVKIAMEYKAAYKNLMDLIQEGNMGLMRAVDKYDLEKNVRFSSYASWWIRAFILKFIIDNFRLVKVGTTQAQKKLFFNLMKEKEKVEKLGFKATPKLLSERLGVKEKEVKEMEVRMGAREFELDAPKANFDNARHMDFLEDKDKPVDEQAEANELQDLLLDNLKEFTETLNEKEKKIFSERLFTEMPKTLQEIANDYGISRERIRQIENRMIKKMREFFKEKGLDVNIQKKST